MIRIYMIRINCPYHGASFGVIQGKWKAVLLGFLGAAT
jgi:hypothetical protein